MDPLLTVDAVAPILGVSRRAVYELAESKDPAVKLPAVRIGRRLRFRVEDVERYVAERTS